MAKLGEVCAINPKSCALRDDTEVSFVPMTKVGEHGEFDASEIKSYSEVKKGFTNFQNGDILFAKITPCMENGKGAIAQNMKNGIGFGSTEFHVLRPDMDKIMSEWLYYLTTWENFRKEAEKNMTGSAGQKRVPKAFLENYTVDLPQIDSQKCQSQILRKVDDLILLCEQQLDKLDELVKARFVEMFGELQRTEYSVKSLDELCEFIRDGTHQTPTYVDAAEGYKFLSSKDVTSGYIDWSAIKYIPKELHEELYKRIAPRRGDILLAKNGTTGIPAVVETDEIFDIYVSLALLRLKPENNVKYVWTALRMPETKVQFDNHLKGVGVPNLHLGEIKKTKIIVPPLSLQNQFAAFVECVDQQKQTVQQSLEKLELIKKALMQEYFG